MAIEARRYARISLAAYAQISSIKGDINEEYNAVCTNISEAGCCLEVEHLLSGADIDFSIRVAIMMPDTMTRLIANGKIIWLKEQGQDKVGNYLIGIKFQDLKPEDKKRIRTFIQEKLGTGE
jgi:c-di-GMP-binding flagellar brake protein YcgR